VGAALSSHVASFRFCGPPSDAGGWRLLVRVFRVRGAAVRTRESVTQTASARLHGARAAGYSKRIRVGASRMRNTRAGTPATTALAGTSRVTTALVPITALSPTVTPRRMQAP
jgi:hypothetical protein